ncbi:ATP-dependent Clp protease ATP-binding subunit [Crocosphaera sp. UHCC 0190]|uniref:ATP-dependent Clp protease ATP-binding subunit n=1 Tax=Crocosphaera sp. UHCC 0190 TaxID=3110246 RepID=UPI002B21949C|nr:ATP-dependent Clp protease ATP-binding subunit [Crocosphaera sp. UHCC 0190]MEA5512081.1 ATP-dependent Clp protease ATP-binding subunit [Crocosphaera sp. UHCC 0190]
MFENFTDKAIKTIMLAQEEAHRAGQNLVGTEHILLGLIGSGNSVASRVLQEFGLKLTQTRQTIQTLRGTGVGFASETIPFTPTVKQILEKAWQIARKDHHYVTPEHILLVLLSDPNTVGVKVLIYEGIDITALRTTLIKNLGEQQPVAATPRKNPSPFDNFSGSKPTLEQFGTNLSQKAREGKLDPVVGRTKEIERVTQILGRRTKSNPVLVGEPGVGKTAIAEGLAQRIIEGDIPEILQDKEVIALDMGLLVAGTRFRGEFEERLKSIVNQVKEAGNIILVIDELHTLVGAGNMGGAMDASNLLKPALARGELQCLGATTLDEYRQYIEKDAALERRFQPVMVGEPSVEETIEILQGLKKEYEAHHHVKFSHKALEAAAYLGDRYISDRFLPDKAIDLMDEAGSRIHLRHSLQNKVQSSVEGEQETPMINPDSLVPVVDEEDIAQIVASWTGIPVNKLSETDSESLMYLEDNLHQRIVGQDEGVKAVSRAIRRARIGLKNPKRPIASFIFAGPTGVGKTELTKALAQFLFGTNDALIRLDMSEYMEPHTVSKLIGSAPGFIGYEEGGQLTEAVRRKPYSVVLFDEIEKAHPDVFNLLLQLLEDGRLTDSKGRKVDFRNTLIIMTSNVGSKMIEKGGYNLGFETESNDDNLHYKRIREAVNEELKQYFRPEFLNRLDEIIVFRQLTKSEVTQIADILLAKVAQQLQEQRQISLQVTEGFKQLIVNEGYDPSYGARPLRRAIMRRLEDSLAESILGGQVKDGDQIIVDVDEQNKIIVQSVLQPALVSVMG